MGCGVVGAATRDLNPMAYKSRGAEFMPKTRSGAISSCSARDFSAIWGTRISGRSGVIWAQGHPLAPPSWPCLSDNCAMILRFEGQNGRISHF